MFAIDKEQFGAFVVRLRREKNMTQKDLAEKLYVSDKAISKWERGLSIPDVALLIPLAEQLGVTVTELLECRRIPGEESMDSRQAEQLVQTVIGMTAEEQSSRAKRGLPLLLCILSGGLELWVLHLLGISWEEITVSLGIMMLLMAVSGLYFCVFAREKLPKYYDENRISAYSDGFFRMNMPGVYFNNGNWPHILKVGQLWSLLGLTVSPVAFYLFRTLLPESWGGAWLYLMLFLTLGGLFIPMVLVAKKYDSVPAHSRQKNWRDYTGAGVILLVIGFSLGLSLLTGALGTGSGMKVGWSERKSMSSWSASYAYYDGWRSRTINWDGRAEMLYAEVVTESGELDITITDSEGDVLFSRENIGTDAFEIPITGKTGVRITADGHKGSISLYWK